MRISGSSMGVLAVGASLAFGCSAILGIDNLPGPGDAGGDGAGSASGGSGSGGASSSGVTASGVGVSSSGLSSSGVTASGVGVTSSGVSSGGVTDSGGKTDLAAFLGTWKTMTGTETLTGCTGGVADQQNPVPTTVDLVFTPGTTSDLVGTFTGQNSSGCSFLANVVSATTATAPAGQTCTERSGTDTALLTLGAYHFIITGSTTADEVTSATITDETTSVTCTFSSRANYTKM